jgi:hypothetical protein
MSMRRVVLGVATALLVAAPAQADTEPNGHNCAGALRSSFAPQFVSDPPGIFGQIASTQAKRGERGEFVRSRIELLANCGESP